MLGWSRIPRIAPDAVTQNVAAIIERQSLFSPDKKQAVAVWLLHMLRLGFCRNTEIKDALLSTTPYTALKALFSLTHERLMSRLGDIVTHHAREYDSFGDANITLALNPTDRWADAGPSLTIAFSSGLLFSADRLLKHRKPVIRLVLDAFHLIDSLLCPCLTPNRAWNLEVPFYLEEMENEYRELREILRTAGRETAIEYHQSNSMVLHHVDGGDDIEALLQSTAVTLFGMRDFYHPSEALTTLNGIRRVRRRVDECRILYGNSSWLDFVSAVCDTLADSLPNARSVTSVKKLNTMLNQERWDDGEVNLDFGITVSTGTPCENQAQHLLYEELANAGEWPVGRLLLNKVASKDLYRRLELYAKGIGLLFYADHCNQVSATGRFQS